MQLRYLHTLTEIGAEQNTMTVIMMPSEFVQAAGAFAKAVQPNTELKSEPRTGPSNE